MMFWHLFVDPRWPGPTLISVAILVYAVYCRADFSYLVAFFPSYFNQHQGMQCSSADTQWVVFLVASFIAGGRHVTPSLPLI